jgi:hypothetical protein
MFLRNHVDLFPRTSEAADIQTDVSSHVERMEQNIDIWDFSLTDEEMAKIAGKDLGHSKIVNHDDPAFVKFVLNLH